MRVEDHSTLGTGNGVTRPWTLLAGTAALVLTVGLLLAGGAVAQEGDTLVVPEDHDTIQSAIDAASEGATVLVLEDADEAYPGNVTVHVDGLTLCSSQDGTACDGAAENTIIHVLGEQSPALHVTADDVRIEGFFVNVAGPGMGIDASGTTGVQLVDNRVEVGIPDGEFGEIAAMTPTERDFWLDPFVEEVLLGGTLEQIAQERADDEGLLTLEPVVGDEDHVGLFYEGQAPDEAHTMADNHEDPPLVIYEDQGAPESLIHEDAVDEMADRTVLSIEESEHIAPEPYEKIRPGARLTLAGAGCTANWVWTTADEGEEIQPDDEVYLGTAGHCIASGQTFNNQDEINSYNLPIEVCIENCDTVTVEASTWVTIAESPEDIAFARGWDPAPSAGSETQAGDDFALIRLPDEVRDLVDPQLAHWGGVTGSTQQAVGDLAVQYGHGLGMGEMFLTQPRSGVYGINFSEDEINYFGPSIFGDSGSATGLGQVSQTRILEGDLATGILTHGGAGTGGTVFGTSISGAIDDVAEWGIEDWDPQDPVRVVHEDEPIPLPQVDVPEAPVSVSVLDVSTVDDAQLEVEWELPETSSPADVYHVYRDGQQIDSTASTIYLDEGLTEGVEHCYQVQAENEAGTSTLSEEVCATPTQPTLPPTSFVKVLDPEQGDELALVWGDPAQEATFDSFRIERTSPTGDDEVITADASQRDLIDDGLEEGVEYTYSVRLVDGDDASDPVNATGAPSASPLTWPQPQRTPDGSATTGAAGDITVPDIRASLSAGSGITASPLAEDLTGDGSVEILVVEDMEDAQDDIVVRALSQNGDTLEDVWTHTVAVEAPSGAVATNGFGTAAVGDMTGDGAPEVAVYTNHVLDLGAATGNAGKITVLDGATGDLLDADASSITIGTEIAPRLVDLTGDEGLEIVLVQQVGGTESGYYLQGQAVDNAGELDLLFDHQISPDPVYTAPALLDTASEDEASFALGDSTGAVYRCTVQQEDPSNVACETLATLDSAIRAVSQGVLEATEDPSIVAHTSNGNVTAVALDPDGTTQSIGVATGLWTPPGIADLTGDAFQEIASAPANGFQDDIEKVGDVSFAGIDDGELTQLGVLERASSLDTSGHAHGGATIADVTGDGQREVLVGDEDGNIVAIAPGLNGPSPTVAWTLSLDGPVTAPLALADTNGDGALNVIAATEDGEIAVLDRMLPTPTEFVGIDLGSTVDALLEGTQVRTAGDQTDSIGVRASGTGAPGALLTGNAIEASATGIYAGSGSTGMVVEDNEVLMEPGWCDTEGLDLPDAEPGYEAVCASPNVRGVQASAPITVRSNTIQATPVSIDTEDGTVQATGTWGVNVLSEDVTVEDNSFTGWGVAGVIVWSSDADIRENTFSSNSVGVHTSSDPGETVLAGNAFDGNVFAVRLAGSSSPGAQEIQLRENAFQENLFALWLDNDQMHVDARLNDWGLYQADLLEYRIVGEGEDNVVQQVPFLLEDGSPEPGLPTASPASHSANASTCAAHPDADWTGDQCRFLTVQAAVDFSHANGTVVVPMAQDEAAPTPYEEALTIDANSEDEALDGLTVCGSVVAMECAPVDEPTRWGIYSDAEWGTPPVAHQGEAIRMDAASGDSTSLFTRDLVTGEGAPQVDDLHGLGVDVLLESGDCPTHDPRITLRVDTTGDGEADTDYHVYPPEAFDCPQGEWTHIDYLDSERWGSVPGTDQAGAHDELGPDHEILSMNLIWDGGSSSDVAWFDNQRYQDSFFREAGDDCDSADPSNCEADARAQALDRTILDGSQSTEAVTLGADDVTLDTLTLTWQGDADTYAAGVLLKADGASLSNMDIKVQGGGCGLDADDLLSCYEPARTKGIYAPHKSDDGFDETVQIDGLLVEGSTIQGSLVDENGKIGASDGIRGDISNARIQGNELRFWTANGVFLWGDNVTIEDNAFSSSINHVQVCDGTESLVAGNTLRTGQSPVAITGCSGDGAPVLRDNQIGATNQESLWIKDNVHDLDLDARLNHWGAHGTEIIKQLRINDEGEDNEVRLKPYLDASGNAHPPLPEVRCQIDGAFTKVADALDIQDAVDRDLPEDCAEDEPRQIILFDSEEAYTSAVVDERVSLNTMSGTHTGANGAASMQATTETPALSFVEGSEDSTVRGLTLHVAEGATGIQVEADGLTLEQHGGIDGLNEAGRVVFLGDGTGLSATDAANLTVADALFTGLEDGIVADGGANLTVQDSLFLAVSNGVSLTEVETADLLRATFFDAPSLPLLGDSTGVTAAGGNNLTVHEGLFTNVDDALTVSGTQDVNITSTEVKSATNGIQLDAYDAGDDTQQPTGFRANNTDLASTVTPFSMASDTADLDAQATCVDWGVYHAALIEQRIQDQGTNTTVTFQPWTSLDEEDPGAACLTPPDAAFEFDIEHGENSPEDTITRLDNITFVDDSDAGTRDILEWRWDLGDGTRENRTLTNESQDIEHAYDAVETFPVMLTVEDLDGMTSREIVDVDVENLEPGIDTVTAPSFAEDDTYEARIHHSQALTEEDPLLITADDPEQDALSFNASRVNETGNLTPLPGQAELVERDAYGEAELRFDPTPLQANLFDFEVNVTDALDGSTTEVLRVDVWNDAPTFDGVPDLVGGAQDEEVSFSVHAHEPDPDDLLPENVTVDIVPTNGTAAFPEPIDDVFTITEHWEDEGVLIDFAWTPQNIDGEDSYEVQLTAEGPGLSVTETFPLEVREDMFPPILNVQQAPEDAPEGTAAQIVVDATVHADAVKNPVDWEATALSITETEDGNETGPVDDALSADGNTVTWTGTMPEDVDRVEVTISADDGIGVVEITEEINVQLFPEMSVHMPLETSTGISTMQPVHGQPVQLSADASDADGVVEHVNATVTPHNDDLSESELALDFHGDDAWSLTLEPDAPLYATVFPGPGVYDVSYVAVDDEGLELLHETTITVQQLQPPEVTSDDEKFYESNGPLGADVSLSATSTDPNQRILDDEDHEWYRIDGPDLGEGDEEHVGTGTSTSTTAPVGLHTYEIRVTDPYGEVGTATTDVYVWGFITADATLDNADAQRNADEYRYTGTNVLEQIEGTVTVLNDVEDGAESADVFLQATYYGTEGSGESMTYADAMVTTDETGQASFNLTQQLAGQLDGDSIASMPGYHEITLDAVWEDTREHVPNDHPTVPDTYEDSHTISFWVGPPGSQEAVETLTG